MDRKKNMWFYNISILSLFSGAIAASYDFSGWTESPGQYIVCFLKPKSSNCSYDQLVFFYSACDIF